MTIPPHSGPPSAPAWPDAIRRWQHRWPLLDREEAIEETVDAAETLPIDIDSSEIDGPARLP